MCRGGYVNLYVYTHKHIHTRYIRGVYVSVQRAQIRTGGYIIISDVRVYYLSMYVIRLMCVHMYKYAHGGYTYLHNSARAGQSRRVCVSYMHNDYMPIRGVQGCMRTRNTDTGRKRGRVRGRRGKDGTISGIDEQLTRGIGSACVIDLANLPLRPSRC